MVSTLAVADDTAVGRYAHLAVGEGVEGVDGLVAGRARLQVHEDEGRLGSVVVDLANLYLAFFEGFEYAVDYSARGAAVGYLGDGEGAVVDLLYLGAHLEHAATAAVVVARYVDEAAGDEVGQQLERLAAQIGYGGVENLVEIVGQNLGGKAHGDAFGTLGEQQGELGGQRDGLFFAAVVAEGPLGHLGVVEHVEGEGGETRFDVTAGCRRCAGEDVAPVALRFHEEFFLAELHEGVVDGRVAVGMVLHGVAHDVGNLVEAAVVEGLHGVEDAALHGLEAVVDMGHGALEYDV